MDEPENTGDNKKLSRFVPGVSGNPAGRPKGARNKLAEQFFVDMYDAWKGRGIEAINAVIDSRPADFLRAMTAIVPKELKVENTVELKDGDLERRIRSLLRVLGAEVGAPRIIEGEATEDQSEPPGRLSSLQ